MRRATVACVMAATLVGLLGSPAMARQYNNFVFPRGVDIGQQARLIVHGCQHGPTWTAYVYVRVNDSDRYRVLVFEVPGAEPSDDDPIPDWKTRLDISDEAFDPGVHKLTVICVHEFTDGSLDIWFRERRPFRVRG